MQSIILGLLILPGKSEDVKAMFKIMKAERWEEFEIAQRKAGVDKERGFLQTTPTGDMLLIYIESKDIQKSAMYFSESKDSFYIWFTEEIKKNTGVDFTRAILPLPELLVSYDKSILR
jgi:hypothetical protein